MQTGDAWAEKQFARPASGHRKRPSRLSAKRFLAAAASVAPGRSIDLSATPSDDGAACADPPACGWPGRRQTKGLQNRTSQGLILRCGPQPQPSLCVMANVARLRPARDTLPRRRQASPRGPPPHGGRDSKNQFLSQRHKDTKKSLAAPRPTPDTSYPFRRIPPSHATPSFVPLRREKPPRTPCKSVSRFACPRTQRPASPHGPPPHGGRDSKNQLLSQRHDTKKSLAAPRPTPDTSFPTQRKFLRPTPPPPSCLGAFVR